MFQIIQTIHGKDQIIARHSSLEEAACQAEQRHALTNAERTRVVTRNGRVAMDGSGKPWEWVKF